MRQREEEEAGEFVTTGVFDSGDGLYLRYCRAGDVRDAGCRRRGCV
jgi:hypothetical protein